MFGFKQFIPLNEQKAAARGVQHLPHPAESALAARKGAVGSALSNISSVISGRAPLTRKIDDRMSFQVIKKGDKVGVKYKGPGAQYNFSLDDIKKQYANKPYVAGPLMNILKHVHKTLPEGEGEYQGGYLSSLEDRSEEDGHISHTPNTIKYAVPKNSPEGKKLARSPLSIALHSRLDASGRATPIGADELQEHPDVHVMSHVVSDNERKLSPEAKKKAAEHIAAAKKLAKNNPTEHLEGHNETLLRYTNSTIDTGEKPSVKGYKRFLQKYHQKRIDSVKTEKAKAQKSAEMQAALNHVDEHMGKFDTTFAIHHHIQKATYAVADALSRTASGGYKHSIGGQESTGEGFVSNGMKFVPRAFTVANRKRSAQLKAQKSVI